jgi:hypothetical protein
MDEVSGVKVPTGAHFARLDKDQVLVELLKELKVEINPYKIKMDYTFDVGDISKMIKKLKSESKNFDRHKLDFKQFAKKVLSNDYTKFIDAMGYTDYLGLDFDDVLKNYGLDDNEPGWNAADIDWSELVEKIVKKIGKNKIKTGVEIKSIKKTENGFLLNSKLECDGVIIGVTINQLKKLLDNEIYKHIESQKFIKVFAKSEDIKVTNYTVMDSPLRKILPIEKDVFTIAFSDNTDAELCKSKSKDYFEKELQKQLNYQVDLQNIKKIFLGRRHTFL